MNTLRTPKFSLAFVVNSKYSHEMKSDRKVIHLPVAEVGFRSFLLAVFSMSASALAQQSCATVLNQPACPPTCGVTMQYPRVVGSGFSVYSDEVVSCGKCGQVTLTVLTGGSCLSETEALQRNDFYTKIRPFAEGHRILMMGCNHRFVDITEMRTSESETKIVNGFGHSSREIVLPPDALTR